MEYITRVIQDFLTHVFFFATGASFLDSYVFACISGSALTMAQRSVTFQSVGRLLRYITANPDAFFCDGLCY